MTLINTQPLFDFLGVFLGGPETALVIVLALIKIAIILQHVLIVVPLTVWAERRVIGLVQDRPGPNRVGPFGIVQGLVDGIKLLMKEDFIPAGADRTLYLMAPALVLVPAFLAMCIIPFGPIIEGEALLQLYTLFGLQGMFTSSSSLPIAISNPNIGILYVFAITSVGVYGITLAGWSSENKWSLLGGIRASAQMISYEISMSLSIIGVLLIVGSLNLYDIIDSQGDIRFWNVWAQPLGFFLFLVSIIAETNRLPFDLAEGESELTGGFHTEYSSMKFALFFLAEYANMITASAILCVLFLGGYNIVPQEWIVGGINSALAFIASTEAGYVLPSQTGLIIASVLAPGGIAIKIAAVILLMIMLRAMWPRLRYDQVMNLGWKVMLVAGLINLVVTAVGIALLAWWGAQSAGANSTPAAIQAAIGETIHTYKFLIGIVTFAMMIIADRIYQARKQRNIKSKYRTFNAGRSVLKPTSATT
ncbi:MAG: NADH-quinone oxidoreductase subunit NuoH [Sumerlaeia bacterium]